MKVVAFYLPQFHPTTENDSWWGAGFTEWRNVASAQPRFPGHRQPNVPSELGYYDLRLPETRAAQVALAQAHGISAFCYYHYWFDGRRILERPFEEVLSSGTPDFPFCLCWANEAWTRSWSDRDGEVLVDQTYSSEDDSAHAEYLVRAFSDSRYLRVGGRPLFLVYRASSLPNPTGLVAELRRQARAAGLEDPYLCRVESDPWREREKAPGDLGFDASVEFAPDWLDLGPPVPVRSHRQLTPPAVRVFDYAEVMRRALSRPEPDGVWFRCVVPGWDNSPRRQSGAVVLHGSSPELYQRWLEECIRRTALRQPEEKVVFVNAWNEWAEGAYLEPDERHGRAYLEATRAAVRGFRNQKDGVYTPVLSAEVGPVANSVVDSNEPTSPLSTYRLELPPTLGAAAEEMDSPSDSLQAGGRSGVGGGAEDARQADAEVESQRAEVPEPFLRSRPHIPLSQSLRTKVARIRLLTAAWWLERRAVRKRTQRPLDEASPSPATKAPTRSSRGATKARVLVVSPYPLFPAIAGGSVRIFNLLRAVASDFDLHVAVFSTTRDDAAQRVALESFCKSVHFLQREEAPPAQPWSLLPRGAEFFAFEGARRKLRDLAESVGADIVQLEHTEMGQFARLFPGRKVTLTELDISFVTAKRRTALRFSERYEVDRNLWSDALDYRRLLRYEIGSAEACDQVHVMSDRDAETLGRYLSDGTRRLRVIDNGVDCDLFHPRPLEVEPTYDVLFVGSFGHSPNRDAMQWLLAEIWPRLIRLRPRARLAIVGSHPPSEVLERHGSDGIEVLGTVEETAPYYRGSRLLLAPIRAGSGTRLKLLEAFASGTAVVATGLAAEGLEVEDGVHYERGESPEELARATARLLAEPLRAVALASAARELVEKRYAWERCGERLATAWEALLSENGARSSGERSGRSRTGASNVATASETAPAEPPVEISVVIPTRNGGRRLLQSLEAIFAQWIGRTFEVICVDSASEAGEIESMKRFPIRLVSIAAEDFNHGLTRDLGARVSRGRVLVFVNQDAVPIDRTWLHRITAPLLRPGRFAAVQGGIREFPEAESVFYWHSCGPRFYFTSESEGWIGKHGGIGFSTVNAAIRREAWERIPFGWAPILEDKKWQAAAADVGLEIADLGEAAVWHSHTYDLRTLWRRVVSEGHGWRLLGVRYSAAQLLRDLRHGETWRLWLEGRRGGGMNELAEKLFPLIRPLALYWGNRWARDVAL